jgi:hypothetical protein
MPIRTKLFALSKAKLDELSERRPPPGVPPAQTGIDGRRLDVWLKITANSGDVDTDYTISVYETPYSASALATGKKGRNQWERLTNAGYENESVTSIKRLPVDSWHKALGLVLIGSQMTWLFSERNEPNCGSSS